MTPRQPGIADLGLISDRHTCALLDKEGTISWYCPGRFDREAVFSLLVSQDRGGFWAVSAEGKSFVSRRYEGRSSILHTSYTTGGGGMTITDFMPMNSPFQGICRMFSAAPQALRNELLLRKDYGLEPEQMVAISDTIVQFPSTGLYLSASHPVEVSENNLYFAVPAGQRGWAALTDQPIDDQEVLEEAFDATAEAWMTLEKQVSYHGVFEAEVSHSLRALQQLTFEPSGGIIAAATTSLPEVIGGQRNYDYRYVWMRDAALITGALVQLHSTGRLEQDFLGFIAGAMQKNHQSHVSCFYAIDRSLTADHSELPLSGYLGSSPVQIGNTAAGQFQLDAEANILLASKLIYDKFHEKYHWDQVVSIADFICLNWERKDNGIWEEEQQQHYTSSKAFAARGLELMAGYQPDQAVAERWLNCARLIRQYIQDHCMTAEGAYAVFAGSQEVDVTAALFVPWGFDHADSKAMTATISRIEKEYGHHNLYRRKLQEFDSAKEGVFLAASCWMSHYYSISGDLHKAQGILEAVLRCSNDLGYFSEEADVEKGLMLGNFPQTFVHSSFICAVKGLHEALQGRDSTVR